MTEEEQLVSDMQDFWKLPAAPRIALRVIQLAGIFTTATDGSKEPSPHFHEGRKSLGLDVLSMFERGQPVAHPSGQPLLTIYMALREEATKPQEKKLAKPRYDRTAELDDDDPSD